MPCDLYCERHSAGRVRTRERLGRFRFLVTIVVVPFVVSLRIDFVHPLVRCWARRATRYRHGNKQRESEPTLSHAFMLHRQQCAGAICASPPNLAAAADGNRCYLVVGAAISRAVAAAERQTLVRRNRHCGVSSGEGTRREARAAEKRSGFIVTGRRNSVQAKEASGQRRAPAASASPSRIGSRIGRRPRGRITT